jgi:hypothetical protein
MHDACCAMKHEHDSLGVQSWNSWLEASLIYALQDSLLEYSWPASVHAKLLVPFDHCVRMQDSSFLAATCAEGPVLLLTLGPQLSRDARWCSPQLLPATYTVWLYCSAVISPHILMYIFYFWMVLWIDALSKYRLNAWPLSFCICSLFFCHKQAFACTLDKQAFACTLDKQAFACTLDKQAFACTLDICPVTWNLLLTITSRCIWSGFTSWWYLCFQVLLQVILTQMSHANGGNFAIKLSMVATLQ